MNLVQSKVIFESQNHTYTLDGIYLNGITGVLSRRLFQDKYQGIPEHILMKAAERGDLIHSNCHRWDIFKGNLENETIEVQNYARICEENGIQMIANEYLVSDNENYATMIDCVDSNYNLYDIKTTATLDTDYLSWQLSINAYLFELQNPELRAGKLYGIWLRGENAELVEVEKIDKSIIQTLLQADINNEEFINPFKKEINISEIEKVQMIETAIINLKAELKQYEEQKEQFLSVIEAEMERQNIKQWKTDRLTITRVLPTVSTTFDSKLFQSQNPEIYNKFTKQTLKKGYIKITVK